MRKDSRLSLVQLFPAVVLVLLGGSWQGSVGAQDDYELTADSKVQPNVPQGEIQGPFEFRSEVFPGTVRQYWVYVPQQYDANKPACLMVVQDGLNRARGWKMTTVFDNLIHKQEMPVTIGVFVTPGVVPAPGENAEARYNRSFEYDSLGDRYARFLLEELLPEVEKSYLLSSDPNDRAVAGASSGGICAFNVAWERPDSFRRVFCTIGTFVGLRGGNELPVLVRKTEPKPIRVFLQDGSSDNNLYGGSWWVANQDMLAALEWAGYDVNHAWGTGGHDSKHGAAILPDAMRWLWRDYPARITAGEAPTRRMKLLIPGEGWQLVSEGHRFAEGPAVSPTGELYFTDIPNERIHRVDADGKVTVFAERTGRANGLMFGPDGRLFACANGRQQIVAYKPDGTFDVIVEGVESNDLVITRQGLYFTDPENKRVHFSDFEGRHRVVDEGVERPNGIAVSPDQTLLYVADTSGQYVYSYQVQPDGGLRFKQPFFHLHLQYGQTGSGADGMAVDREGHVYVTTRSGLQVCDQPGRVHWILPKPADGWLSNVVLGGPDGNMLYVTCGTRLFRRQVNAQGFVSHAEPLKPPKPRL